MKFLIHVVTLISASLAIPILSPDDQKLNSIVISEIDFTTEHPLIVVDAEISVEPESSFHELIERYDEMYMKTTDENQNVRKRNSQDVEPVEEGGKSLIEKIEIDPDVKKEFEIEISNAMQNQKIATETSEIAESEYDPNYAKKIPENATKLTIHEKEHIQAQLVEQLVHQGDEHEHTTVLPDEVFTHHELVINPDIVEVLEHINYESESDMKAHEHTTVINVVDMDIDPIEIIPKDRHRESRVEVETTTNVNVDESDKGRSLMDSTNDNDNDQPKMDKSENSEEKEEKRATVDTVTDNNDKFAGFAGIPSEDLIEPGQEVTEPDHFFTENKPTKEEEDPTVEDFVEAEAEILRETLEFVAIYGKSLKFNETATTPESVDITTAPPEVESETEIVQVTEKIAINTVIVDSSEEEDENGKKSIANKSSEEVGVGLRRIIIDKSDESSEENNIVENADTQHVNLLTDEVFKESTNHEVKKKDHPDGLTLPYEAIERKFVDEGRQIESLLTDFIDAKTQATITAIYDTFEEIATTVSDGIKLSDELRQNVNSFRDDSQEDSIVLDTLREAISSKNSKAPLLISDEMTIAENRLHLNGAKTQISMMAIISLIALISMIMLGGLFMMLKRRTERFYIV